MDSSSIPTYELPFKKGTERLGFGIFGQIADEEFHGFSSLKKRVQRTAVSGQIVGRELDQKCSRNTLDLKRDWTRSTVEIPSI